MIHLCVFERCKGKQSVIIESERSALWRCDVHVKRGGKVAECQETTQMTTAASLISVQSYQAPRPCYKCHLSPRDWDRKLSAASVINIDLESYKKPLSLF